jgi:uncharacterized protein (DUF2141 family)
MCGEKQFSRRATLALLLLIVPIAAAPASAQSNNNPVPLIYSPLTPETIAPGSPGLTLTVNGTGFVQSSVVYWNGSPRSTTFVSASQLHTAILKSDLAAAGPASVTVVNSLPGQVSNSVPLQVTNPTSSVSFMSTTLAPANLTSWGQQSSITADFNGDGKLDLANIAGDNALSTSLVVYLGNGDGTFQNPVTYPITQEASTQSLAALAVGDFSGDGKLDLAIVVNNCSPGSGQYCSALGSVAILLGNGDGTFQQPVNVGTHYAPDSIVAADFNGDGLLDIAVTDSSSLLSGYPANASIAVLLGNGDGSFQPYVEFPAPNAHRGLVAADFNGDGHIDLASLGYPDGSYPNSIYSFLGNGDGTFQPYQVVTTGFYPQAIAVADLNGDGKLDLVVPNYCAKVNQCDYYNNVPGSVSILLGNGDGTFQTNVEYQVGLGPIWVLINDLNGDGKPDLAIGTQCGGDLTCQNNNGDMLSILFGNGDGTFQPQATPYLGSGANVQSGVVWDFNGDGLLDFSASSTSVFLESTLALSSTTLTFGNQTVGTGSQPKALTLSNVSTKVPITISAAQVTGTNASDFSLKTTCSKLWARSACKVNVIFKPTAPGTRTATVVVTDSAVGSPHQITVTGSGRHRK